MNRWLIVFVLGALIAAGCSSFPDETEHGFQFKYHRNTARNKAQIGDVLFVQFQIRTAEQILFESPNGESGLRTVLSDPSLNPIKEPDPIADVLPKMGLNDSVTVRMPVTDDMRVAFGLETADYIYYEVVIRAIGDEASDATTETIEEETVSREELVAISDKLARKLEGNNPASEALRELHQFVFTVQETDPQAALLGYYVLEKGRTKPELNDRKIGVKHIGIRSDSLLVSESFSGVPFLFTPGAGQVIRGWEEAIEKIGPGGRLLLVAPPKKAYGATGRAPMIGPTDTLYYYLEWVE